MEYHIDGLVQDCCNPSALAMELLQYCTQPSMYTLPRQFFDRYVSISHSKQNAVDSADDVCLV